jgi:carnitine O-acetyltransferase
MATRGLACDRHLLGLLLLAREHGMDTSFFADAGWQKSTHFRLSTSQVPTMTGFLGFGPVVEDGYGCAYSLNRAGEFIFTVSAWNHCAATNATALASAIAQALRDFRSCLLSASPTAAKL